MSNTTTTAAGFTLPQIAAMFEADEWQISLPAAEEDADLSQEVEVHDWRDWDFHWDSVYGD